MRDNDKRPLPSANIELALRYLYEGFLMQKKKMSKDPAVLFYTSDFLTGTTLMSNEQVGKYIRLLCIQHQRGILTEKDMMKICETYDEDIFEKFEKTEEGYFNQRMRDEFEKRKKYSESRANNRKKKEDMKNICNSYEQHMEIENENEIEVTLTTKNKTIKRFVKPTIDELKDYMKEIEFNGDAEYFYNYYESNGWVVGRAKMKDWKSAVQNWKRRDRTFSNKSEELTPNRPKLATL